jgi:hypothetical protein
MHTYGIGVSQDVHLAKRHLDQVLEKAPQANSTLAIASLLIQATHTYDKLASRGVLPAQHWEAVFDWLASFRNTLYDTITMFSNSEHPAIRYVSVRWRYNWASRLPLLKASVIGAL